MQVETVEFKMDVSDENIKREVMKIVWMPGTPTQIYGCSINETK